MRKYRLYSRKQGWITEEVPPMKVFTSSIIEGNLDIYNNKIGKLIETMLLEKSSINDTERILLNEVKKFPNWYLYPNKTNIGEYTLL